MDFSRIADTALPRRAAGRPLYTQVRELLTRQISSGDLRPGEALPSEFRIAEALGVSQGTVRKALDAMASERLVARRQGRGTFVTEQTPEDIHFRFFPVFDAEGHRILPLSIDVRVRRMAATHAARARLGLRAGGQIWELTRTRTLADGRAFMTEKIALPTRLFPRLDRLGETGKISNALYDMFQKTFGVTVLRVEDTVCAARAGMETGRALVIDPDTPILAIERVAFAPDGKAVEWRSSRGLLAGMVYRASAGAKDDDNA
ncbi:MAG: GntR family transcriptional regulator [Pseudomonadota bacterium]